MKHIQEGLLPPSFDDEWKFKINAGVGMPLKSFKFHPTFLILKVMSLGLSLLRDGHRQRQ